MQTTYDENTNTTKYEFENMTLIKNNENGYYRLIDICKSCGKNGSTNDITSKNWYQKIIAESSKELHKEAQYETRCNPKGIFIHEYCILLIVARFGIQYYINISNMLKQIEKIEHETLINNLSGPINRQEPYTILFKKTEAPNIYEITCSVCRKSLDKEYKSKVFINGDDVFKIFKETLKKYRELDCISKTHNNYYYIKDIDKVLNMFDEIKNNTFDISNYGIDKNIKINTLINNMIKYHEEGKIKSGTFKGFLYEVFSLKYLKKIESDNNEIYLWKCIPQHILNKYNLNHFDYGKDIIDAKNKIIYQCKFYTDHILKIDKLETFINESLRFKELGFKSVLICSNIDKIHYKAMNLLKTNNIDVLELDGTNVENYIKAKDIKIKLDYFDTTSYVLNNWKKNDDDILKYFREYYKPDYKMESLKNIRRKLCKQYPELERQYSPRLFEAKYEIIKNYPDLKPKELADLITKKLNLEQPYTPGGVKQAVKSIQNSEPDFKLTSYNTAEENKEVTEFLKKIIESDLKNNCLTYKEFREKIVIELKKQFPNWKTEFNSTNVEDRLRRLNFKWITTNEFDQKREVITKYIRDNYEKIMSTNKNNLALADDIIKEFKLNVKPYEIQWSIDTIKRRIKAERTTNNQQIKFDKSLDEKTKLWEYYLNNKGLSWPDYGKFIGKAPSTTKKWLEEFASKQGVQLEIYDQSKQGPKNTKYIIAANKIYELHLKEPNKYIIDYDALDPKLKTYYINTFDVSRNTLKTTLTYIHKHLIQHDE